MLPPLDHRDGLVVEGVLQAEFGKLLGRCEPVKIEVLDRGYTRIGMPEGERWARCRVVAVERRDDRPHEGRFPGAQIPREGDAIPRLQMRGDVVGEIDEARRRGASSLGRGVERERNVHSESRVIRSHGVRLLMDGDVKSGIESIYAQAISALEAGFDRVSARLAAGGFDTVAAVAEPPNVTMSYVDEEQPTSPAQPSPYGSSAVRGLGEPEGAATSGRPLVDFSWEDSEGTANF